MPKLPVPDLQTTMDKYLACLQSIAKSDDNFMHVEKLIHEFCQKDGMGPKLQNILLERAKDRDNWVVKR